MKNKLTLIIDANNLGYIQLHALGNDLSHEEQCTGIIWGFFRALGQLADRFETTRFVFCWDSRKSKRRLIDPDYKGNRARFNKEKTRDVEWDEASIHHQLGMLRNVLLHQFGFRSIFVRVGYEADDLIASVVRNWKTQPPPIIVSTDKDLYQLLDHCSIWRPVTREMFLYEDFIGKYGVKPMQWPGVRAMSGDPSDNIRGIPGVGDVTAIRFVNGDLSLKAKARQSIVSEEGQRIIDRNTRLMMLPLPGTPVIEPDLTGERFMTDDFIKISERYGFRSFLEPDEFEKWRKRFHMVD